MKFNKIIVLASSVILAMLSTSALADNNMEVYGKAGIPGVGVGVGYGINENFTVRGDFSTLGRISRHFNHRAFDFDAKFKTDKLNVHADIFPLDNGLRFTTGFGIGRTELKATGRSENGNTQSFKIGGKNYTIDLGSNDTLNVDMKYPAVSPYFGLGWGHHIQQQKAGDWGFTADLGLYVGRPKTSVNISNDLREKLANSDIAGKTKAEALAEVDSRIAQEKSKIQDKIGKYKVIPVATVGVTYRF